MSLPKPKENLKVAILVPCYKRSEYTIKCIKALEADQYSSNTTFFFVDDGSHDGTDKILSVVKVPKVVIVNEENKGLRSVLINFIQTVITGGYDLMGVMGNDCVAPKGWLNYILDAFDKTDAEVLSPNVFPSNPAYIYGGDDMENKGYRPSRIVGGLWYMAVDLARGIEFERHDVKGITGAFNVLQQILIEKDPIVGWLPGLVVQDLGHWSGRHPEHIKNVEHAKYYAEVGRGVTW
jgi:GT2 family glycosyltransferase